MAGNVGLIFIWRFCGESQNLNMKSKQYMALGSPALKTGTILLLISYIHVPILLVHVSIYMYIYIYISIDAEQSEPT